MQLSHGDPFSSMMALLNSEVSSADGGGRNPFADDRSTSMMPHQLFHTSDAFYDDTSDGVDVFLLLDDVDMVQGGRGPPNDSLSLLAQPSAELSRSSDHEAAATTENEFDASVASPCGWLASIGQSVFGHFPDPRHESKFVEFRLDCFSQMRVVWLAVASLALSIGMIAIAVLMALADDSTNQTQTLAIAPSGVIFWFAVGGAVGVMVGMVAWFAGDKCHRNAYRLMFFAYVSTFLVGMYKAPPGSTMQQSTIIFVVMLHALSLIRPPWASFLAMIAPDLVVSVFFLVREVVLFDRDKGVGVALLAQISFGFVELVAIRILLERQERHHFACLHDTESYREYINEDLASLQLMLQRLAPDATIAKEMVRRFRVAAGAAALPAASSAVDTAEERPGKDLVWHMVALRTAPSDVYFAVCAFDEIVPGSTCDDQMLNPVRRCVAVLETLFAKELYVVISPAHNEVALFSRNPAPILSAVSTLHVSLASSLMFKAFLHCGHCVGGVLGDHSDPRCGSSMRFEYYGAPITHCREVARDCLQWNSVAASSRFWRFAQWYIRDNGGNNNGGNNNNISAAAEPLRSSQSSYYVSNGEASWRIRNTLTVFGCFLIRCTCV